MTGSRHFFRLPSPRMLWLFLLIISLVVIAFWPLLSMQVSMRWDATNIYLPWKYHITESLKNGVLPLWNPSMQCGFPQMGDPGTWYPVSWILGFLFLRYDFCALNLEYLLHIAIAGLGFYRLASLFIKNPVVSVITAASYMLSGFFISQAQHLGWIVSAAWIPWCMAITIQMARKPSTLNALLLSIVLYLLFTGGYPGLSIVTLYVLIFAFILTIYHSFRIYPEQKTKGYWRILWVPILFILLCAPALLSSLELLSLVTRGSALGDTGALSYQFGSLSVRGLISMVFPYALTSGDTTFWHEDVSLLNVYFGMIPLILLLSIFLNKGKPRIALGFLLLGIFFLLTAMASTFPIRSWLYHALPLMDLFRFPSLFRLFAICFFILASGLMLEECLQNIKARKHFVILSLIFIISGIVLLFILRPPITWEKLFLLFQQKNGINHFSSLGEKIFLQASMQILLMAFSILMLSWKKLSPWKGLLIALVIFIDLGLAARMNFYATVADPLPIQPGNEAFRHLPFAFPHPSTTQALEDISDQRYYHTIPLSWRNVPVFHKMPSSESYNPYTLENTHVSMASGEYQQAIKNPLLFVEPAFQKEHVISGIQPPIIIKKYNPNKMELEVKMIEAGSLVYLQNYYPRWRAFVNGKEQVIHPYKTTFMTLELPQGQHSIVFKFMAGDIKLAFALSSITLILILIIVIRLWVKPQTSPKRAYNAIAMLAAGIILLAISIRHLQQRTNEKAIMEDWDTCLAQLKTEDSVWNHTLIIHNTDGMRAALKEEEGNNMEIMRIHHETELCQLHMRLRQDTSDYLLYRQVNLPRFARLRSLIQTYYPYIIREEANASAYWIFARKEPGIEWYDISREESTSMSKNEKILGKAPIEDCLLDTVNAYSKIASWPWEEIYEATEGEFQLNCEIQAPADAEVGLVILTASSDQVTSWQMEALGKYICEPDTSLPLTCHIDLRQIRNPGKELRVFFWNNKDTIPVRINNVRFSYSKQNQ